MKSERQNNFLQKIRNSYLRLASLVSLITISISIRNPFIYFWLLSSSHLHVLEQLYSNIQAYVFLFSIYCSEIKFLPFTVCEFFIYWRSIWAAIVIINAFFFLLFAQFTFDFMLARLLFERNSPSIFKLVATFTLFDNVVLCCGLIIVEHSGSKITSNTNGLQLENNRWK